jgi:3-keto-disaccharide hydrolase
MRPVPRPFLDWQVALAPEAASPAEEWLRHGTQRAPGLSCESMHLWLACVLPLLLQGDAGGLSELEREAGWVELFDGQTLAGWHTFGEQGVRSDGWEVVERCLHLPAGARAGDLVIDGEYGDFELELEWKVAVGSNSGIKYRVPEVAGSAAMLGPEYQVLDDANNAEGGDGAFSAGALYALYEPHGKELAPTGDFNRTRIVARGDRIEHWLNGVRVVECSVGSADWETRRAASKFAPHQDFARGYGHIGVQDHGGEVWFRRIRLRCLEHPPGEPVELFDGKSPAGWKALGDARYSVDDGCILGEVGEGGHSFLVSERSFGDFLLEVEVKAELPGNSGIQIRSHVDEEQRVFGYQVEIDPTERGWSGGIYDEGRRGIFLDDRLAGGSAFRPGEWNEYRIECLGPWIRTWINGVPAADVLDPLDLEGFIGLQVHSGHDTRVRWRNFRMRDLGTRSWERLTPEETAAVWCEQHGTGATVCTLTLAPLDLGLRVTSRSLRQQSSTTGRLLPETVTSLLNLSCSREGSEAETSPSERIWEAEDGDLRRVEIRTTCTRLVLTSKGSGLDPELTAGNASLGASVEFVHWGEHELDRIERLGPPRRGGPTFEVRRY